VLSRAPADRRAGRAALAGVEVEHFGPDWRSTLGLFRSAIAGARRATARALADGRVDVLNAFQPLAGWGALGAAAARGVPALYTFLSPAPLEYRSRRGMTRYHMGGAAGAVGAALLWLVEGACLRRAARIVVLSDYSADQLWRLYRVPAERTVKIPGGVDLARFTPGPDRAGARARLGLPPDRALLLTVRNLEARMGLAALLRALAILRMRVPDVLLLVGGEGSRRAELEALAGALGLARQVRFLGRVAEDLLADHYRAADVFVLPTRELEGFGLVTVEALACGTPVLGTPVGATTELLEPLDPGLLFRDATPEAMAEGLAQFLAAKERDPLATERLGRACRRHAEAYGWGRALDALEATLGSLARRAPAAPAPPRRCPACEGTLRPDLVYRGRRYARCARCGLRAAASPLDAAALRRCYEIDYPRRFPPETSGLPRRALFEGLLARARPPAPGARLLDVGCGGGLLLAGAAARGWRAVGVELSSRAARVARNLDAGPVVQAHGAALPFRSGALDAVTLVNILDHLEAPSTALAEARRVLRPGGLLVVRVPNGTVHGIAARLLARLGPGARWRGWDAWPILHAFAFGHGALVRLVERAGFVRARARNSPRAEGAGGGARVAGVALAAAGALAAAVSAGRWLVGPSIEVWAETPGGEARGPACCTSSRGSRSAARPRTR
jgi:glycosyltransferase involved in cell wall biosynthesis/SAM-dependent methyltransferase